MTESLLSLSNILLFGQTVEDLTFVDADPTGATPVDAATTPPPPPIPPQNGNQTVDGVNLTPAAGANRVLVKDLGNPNNNGVYTVKVGNWTRDVGIVDRSVVAVNGGTVNIGTNWVAERREVGGGNIHYRFFDSSDRERRRRGANRQLGEQLSAADVRIAKIYGYSYEGCYYDLVRPTLFLVHGDGEVVTEAPTAAPVLPHRARAPRHPSLTGLAGADFDFADDIRFWSYDKGDFSIRMDVSTGTLEDILLEAEVDAQLQITSAAKAQISGAAKVQISHAAKVQIGRRSDR